MFKATGEEFESIYDVYCVKDAIIEYIKKRGYVLYPHEIVVWHHGTCDVACISPYSREVYALEIKEKGDSISTGIEQCKGYLSAFDYAYIVGAVRPKKESLMRMERLGIGYAQVKIEKIMLMKTERSDAKIHCLRKAHLNHPNPKQRESIVDRFKKYSTLNRDISVYEPTGRDKKLDDYGILCKNKSKDEKEK